MKAYLTTRNLLAVLAIALIVAFIAIKGCTSQRQVAQQAKHDNRSASATIQAAANAAKIIENRTGEDAKLKDVVDAAAKDIANAEGADQKITPAVRDATLRAACQLPNYRDEPACRVLAPGP